jgi:TolB-like protein
MRLQHSILSIAFATIAMGLPCSSSAQTQPADTTVLVLPFSSPSNANQQWIGKAVQQDLLTDLTEGTTTHVIAPSSIAPADDNDAALRAARDRNAAFVVFGQAQSTDKEVRLTGQVLDVASGTTLGALKATGPADELFHLEDALAGQAFMALPRPLLTAQAQQGLQQAQQGLQQAQQGLQQAQQGLQQAQQGAQQAANNPAGNAEPPNTTEPQTVYPPIGDFGQGYTAAPQYDTYPTYNYYTTPDYGYYPAYTYGYPYWNTWPFFGTAFFVSPFRDFHHHHDFDHHDFDHDHGGHFDGGHHAGSIGHNGFANGFNHFNRGGSSSFSQGRMGAASISPRSTFQGRGGFSPSISRSFNGQFHSSAPAHIGGGSRGFSSGGFSHSGFSGGHAGISGGVHAGGGAHAGGGGGHR